MALFGIGKSKVRPAAVVEMVEKLLQKHRLDPEAQAIDASEGTGWWLNKGAALIYVFVIEETHSAHLRVTCPIVHFPHQKREEFFLHLLEVNRDLSTCCLSAFQEVVMVTAQRPITGLQFEELEYIINQVGGQAEKFEKSLSRQFGALPYREDPHCAK